VTAVSSAAHATPSAPVPAHPNPLPFILSAAAGVMGATAKRTRKMDLSQAYIFGGETFGPGSGIEVPDDFPDIDGETGAVIHEEGTAAARNAATSARANAGIAPVQMGASTAASPATGPGTTVSGKSAEELDAMTKDELVALAETSGVTVTREDGTDGAPLKADYVRVLGATK
jgi:hypothetical protein